MSGHDEIRRILLDILQVGLLRIRGYGNSGLAEACSLEADHLHNLPVLIQYLRREDLLYYYNVERPCFLNLVTSNVDAFKLLWEQLAKLIQEKE